MKRVILESPGAENNKGQVPARKHYKKPALTEYGNIAELTKGNGNKPPHDVLNGVPQVSLSGGSHAPIRFTPTP